MTAKSTNPKESTQLKRRDSQTILNLQEIPENKGSTLEQEEIEIIYPQSNIECEHYLTLNDLQKTNSELSELKKENAILKKEISKLETEKQSIQSSIKHDSAEAQKMLRTLNVEKSDMVKKCFPEMNLPQSQRTKKFEYCVKQNRNNVCKQQQNRTRCVKALSLINKIQKSERNQRWGFRIKLKR